MLAKGWGEGGGGGGGGMGGRGRKKRFVLAEVRAGGESKKRQAKGTKENSLLL